MKRIFKLKSLILFLVSSGFVNNIFAQTNEGMPESLIKLNILFLLLVFLLVIAAFGYFGMEKKIERPDRISPIISKVKNHITGLVPLEKEKDILLDHDYDGIKELDNRIPPWFNYLFLVTILFAVYYMIDYHILGTGLLPKQEYEEEIRIAAVEREQLINSGAFLNENSVTLLSDETSLLSGKDIFKKNCIPCHGENGQGTVGPNLTDEYWIHGSGIRNVFTTIKYGVQAKGMVSWQGTLNPTQIQEVASYIVSLQGTNPPNAKQPEGTKFSEPDSSKTISMLEK
ncbi:MAG TPA: cbb3-type cytochrome c oxidase N-terminal domain-containing protein [Ignavibacteriaceae bacterium]|nr:cbb3-type cytochrome c oxidase N-terminal domain-containing protein [Ignavibacteriaceae bacterium]